MPPRISSSSSSSSSSRALMVKAECQVAVSRLEQISRRGKHNFRQVKDEIKSAFARAQSAIAEQEEELRVTEASLVRSEKAREELTKRSLEIAAASLLFRGPTVTVEARGATFRAHRGALSAASAYFDADHVSLDVDPEGVKVALLALLCGGEVFESQSSEVLVGAFKVVCLAGVRSDDTCEKLARALRTARLDPEQAVRFLVLEKEFRAETKKDTFANACFYVVRCLLGYGGLEALDDDQFGRLPRDVLRSMLMSPSMLNTLVDKKPFVDRRLGTPAKDSTTRTSDRGWRFEAVARDDGEEERCDVAVYAPGGVRSWRRTMICVTSSAATSVVEFRVDDEFADEAQPLAVIDVPFVRDLSIQIRRTIPSLQRRVDLVARYLETRGAIADKTSVAALGWIAAMPEIDDELEAAREDLVEFVARSLYKTRETAYLQLPVSALKSVLEQECLCVSDGELGVLKVALAWAKYHNSRVGPSVGDHVRAPRACGDSLGLVVDTRDANVCVVRDAAGENLEVAVSYVEPVGSVGLEILLDVIRMPFIPLSSLKDKLSLDEYDLLAACPNFKTVFKEALDYQLKRERPNTTPGKRRLTKRKHTHHHHHHHSPPTFSSNDIMNLLLGGATRKPGDDV